IETHSSPEPGRGPVLLVEDDRLVADAVALGLREEGIEVVVARDGGAGRRHLDRDQWGLVILDWWLPQEDGLSLLVRLRCRDATTPVLMLTAKDAVSDRVRGLQAGADDYLCKPFAFDELLARVQALLRRSSGAARAGYKDVVLDLVRRKAWRASH